MGKKKGKKKERIGRNDPCFCGTKKPNGTPVKYKNCHLQDKSEIIELMKNKMESQNRERRKLEKMGIYINYVNPCTYVHPKTKKSHRVWALGNRVFHSRPANETFHEFIISHLKEELGKDWWIEQLHSQNKHFLFQCFVKYDEWRVKNAKIEENRVDDKVFYAITDGWSKTLASLAFDVCSLEHQKQLPEHLMRRLRSRDGYQGANYEISVAAIFARLNCDIEFLDDENNTEKHCEFFATHRPTKTVIAVEAKSRHRSGIKNTTGQVNPLKSLKGDVQRLFNRALKQNPKDKPFIIFIDVNSPLTPSIKLVEKQWFKDIRRMLSNYGTPTKDKPDEFTVAVFTNFSPHYQEEQESSPNEYFAVFPQYSLNPIEDRQFTTLLNNAITHYGKVPNITEQD